MKFSSDLSIEKYEQNHVETFLVSPFYVLHCTHYTCGTICCMSNASIDQAKLFTQIVRSCDLEQIKFWARSRWGPIRLGSREHAPISKLKTLYFCVKNSKTLALQISFINFFHFLTTIKRITMTKSESSVCKTIYFKSILLNTHVRMLLLPYICVHINSKTWKSGSEFYANKNQIEIACLFKIIFWRIILCTDV